MASPTDIRKGRVIDYQGAPHLVLEMMHRTQGRQAGFVQSTLRNLNTGSTTTTKFRSTDNVEFLHTETNKLEFSYVDQDGYHFMDPETYEDTILPADLMEEAKDFMVENVSYDVLFVDGRAIQLQLPGSIEMVVTDAPEGLKGDSVSNVQKSVTLETGLIIQAPLFIKTGEKIKVSTDTRTYQGRA
jgi:elongation factor P